VTAEANESLDAEGSGLIVTGFDSGDGLTIRLAASEDEARGGIFTSFGVSFRSEVCSIRALGATDVEDGVGFVVISRLVP
jgi:hypothetical protein